METKELIIVSGPSGAGKTTANRYLEKSGYYTIDNLPATSLYDVVSKLDKFSKYRKFAISINTLLMDEPNVRKQMDRVNALDWIKVRIIYLEVDNEELLRRYTLTRKKHPLSISNESLEQAIEQEELMLRAIKPFANYVIDTSTLTTAQLQIKLKRIFDNGKEIVPSFIVDFVSFGYKHGVPKDLDYAFDVRFLPNPYYIPELKELTGNNHKVYDYVMKQEKTQEFIEQLIPFLDYCIQQQKDTNRSYLVIGVGCTGGQHRSVSIANYLAKHYETTYSVVLDHRDAKNEE